MSIGDTSDALRNLAPIVGRMRDLVLLQSALEALPADRLRSARELAADHLLRECGYCLDERNRGDAIHRWTIDYMREVALSDEVLDRIDSGRYVVRVTKIGFNDPPERAARPREMLASSEPMEIPNAEDADAFV